MLALPRSFLIDCVWLQAADRSRSHTDMPGSTGSDYPGVVEPAAAPAAAPVPAQGDVMSEFLTGLGLDSYIKEMQSNGHTSVSGLKALSEAELEALCMDEEHRVEMKKREYKQLSAALQAA